MLADMAIQIEAARLLTYKAATVEPPQVALSSMAKVLASDVAVKVATDAVQLGNAVEFEKLVCGCAAGHGSTAQLCAALDCADERCQYTATLGAAAAATPANFNSAPA